mmetsp:Transcript_65380/g.151677  ORF Transcript_65380/g.151677 Transcript_65380/m.151677 type:complete len:411 (+) Transcript_65380:468-1700(+)
MLLAIDLRGSLAVGRLDTRALHGCLVQPQQPLLDGVRLREAASVGGAAAQQPNLPSLPRCAASLSAPTSGLHPLHEACLPASIGPQVLDNALGAQVGMAHSLLLQVVPQRCALAASGDEHMASGKHEVVDGRAQHEFHGPCTGSCRPSAIDPNWVAWSQKGACGHLSQVPAASRAESLDNAEHLRGAAWGEDQRALAHGSSNTCRAIRQCYAGIASKARPRKVLLVAMHAKPCRPPTRISPLPLVSTFQTPGPVPHKHCHHLSFANCVKGPVVFQLSPLGSDELHTRGVGVLHVTNYLLQLPDAQHSVKVHAYCHELAAEVSQLHFCEEFRHCFGQPYLQEPGGLLRYLHKVNGSVCVPSNLVHDVVIALGGAPVGLQRLPIQHHHLDHAPLDFLRQRQRDRDINRLQGA